MELELEPRSLAAKPGCSLLRLRDHFILQAGERVLMEECISYSFVSSAKHLFLSLSLLPSPCLLPLPSPKAFLTSS